MRQSGRTGGQSGESSGDLPTRHKEIELETESGQKEQKRKERGATASRGQQLFPAALRLREFL
jgi:hypothetical protein